MMYSMFHWELSKTAAIARDTRSQKEREELKQDIQQLNSKLPFPQLREIWLRVLNRIHAHEPWATDERKLIATGLLNPVTEGMRFLSTEIKDWDTTKEFLFSIAKDSLALSLTMIRNDSMLNNIMSMGRWVSTPSISDKSSRMGKIALKLEAFLSTYPEIDLADENKKLMPNNRFAFAGFTKENAEQFPNIAKYLQRLGYALEIEEVQAQSPRKGR